MSAFSVSITPKNSSVLASPMIPNVSGGKMLTESSSTPKGIDDDTPRWNLPNPSPADENGGAALVNDTRFVAVEFTMSDATSTVPPPLVMTMFWKAAASLPPSNWAVRVSVRVLPVPTRGAVMVWRVLSSLVPSTTSGSLRLTTRPPSMV